VAGIIRMVLDGLVCTRSLFLPWCSQGLAAGTPLRLIGENKGALVKLMMLTRLGAGATVLIITLLSVVPGNMRPHILGNDRFEHFVAYLLVGSLWAIGRPSKLLSSGMLLAIGAGTLEFAQLWIPGRTSSTGDFATSAIGAWTGLLAIIAIRWAYKRSPPSY
jgi:VanZ family protein